MKQKFDLKYFIHKTNTLLMYREVFKFCNLNIKEEDTRREMQKYIRSEFEKYKTYSDSSKAEYLLADGRKKINLFKESFTMTK